VLTLSPGIRVFLATEPIDLRRGHDGLCALVRTRYDRDPYDGSLFVFVGRRGDRIKVLYWDRGGFMLLYKRLERGRFKIPPVAKDATSIMLDAASLALAAASGASGSSARVMRGGCCPDDPSSARGTRSEPRGRLNATWSDPSAAERPIRAPATNHRHDLFSSPAVLAARRPATTGIPGLIWPVKAPQVGAQGQGLEYVLTMRTAEPDRVAAALPRTSHLREPVPVHFPTEETVPETTVHLELRAALYTVMKLAFGERATIGSDQFVYWDPTDPRQCLAPDVAPWGVLAHRQRPGPWPNLASELGSRRQRHLADTNRGRRARSEGRRGPGCGAGKPSFVHCAAGPDGRSAAQFTKPSPAC